MARRSLLDDSCFLKAKKVVLENIFELRRLLSMETKIRRIGLISGILTFIICLIAGIYVLATTNGFDSGSGGVYTGIGIYFIGKAFFVGPMLLITTLHMTVPKENLP